MLPQHHMEELLPNTRRGDKWLLNAESPGHGRALVVNLPIARGEGQIAQAGQPPCLANEWLDHSPATHTPHPPRSSPRKLGNEVSSN